MTEPVTPPQTIGQVREQLATCQTDLGRAIEQLKLVEGQLASAGQSPDIVASLREQIEGALVKLQPVLDEIEELDEQDAVTDHREKFAKIAGFFEEIEGLQKQF